MVVLYLPNETLLTLGLSRYQDANPVPVILNNVDELLIFG